MSQSLYNKESNKILTDFLFEKERDSDTVEFVLSSVCNQSCEYCYLFKHGKELYPPEANNFNNIVENFPILLDWLEENKFNFKSYDLFSGEYFKLPIWEDILQIIYDRERKRLDYNLRNNISKNVSIPTNCSFLMDDKQTEKIENWMDKFNEINMDLLLSLSVEGPQDLEKLERPLKAKNQEKNQDNFYKKFFAFRKKYHMSSHPMITKNFVKNYKRNYDWWIDTTIENEIMQINDRGQDIYAIPMLLEVRDAEQWDTEEALNNYRDFLNYVADKDFKCLHNNDLDDFAYHFFDDFTQNRKVLGLYDRVQPYIIGFPYLVNRLTCSIQGGAVFRVGDLAYIPCHRTCYDHFVYGHLKKENNKIVELEAERLPLAIKIKNLNPNRSILRCTSCPLNSMCIKGCLGSQYEHTNELFCAEDEVCNMFYTKYKTIHEIALRYDLYEWLDNQYTINPQRKEFIHYAKRILESI